MSLVLQNVEVNYGDREALTIESLVIKPGSITAVMGPNGAGKTTLLKVLAGLLDPGHGSLTYRGDHVGSDSVARFRQRVCLVHQVPLLFDTTVFENVAFGLKARRIPREEIRQTVIQALTVVGCSDLKKRRARELSGGEVKRVAIARALVLDPEVLLLDEPLADVDQITTKTLEEVFRNVEGKGRTLIFSTHDPRLAHRLAQEVVVLTNGRLSSSPYENLFSGQTVLDGEASWFDTGKIRIAIPAGLFNTGHISIGADEILISKQPLQSSARNVFQGRLRRIEERGEGVLDAAVEADESFTVRLTRQSFQDLNLTVGDQVYITFKSTSVKPL